MSELDLNNIAQLIEDLRNKSPLTHCITNVVTVRDCANAVLAIGASPIMANEVEEAKDITSLSDSLIINIGTITTKQKEAMIISAKTAFEDEKQFVLDPVGVGISDIRNDISIDIIKNYKPSIIRGNLSEIKAIATMFGILEECTVAKGVDVAQSDIITNDLESNCSLIKNIANKLNTTIAVSGKIDIISDGHDTYMIDNGDALMSNITGTGCMLGCIMSSFLAVATPINASIIATLVMTIAGENASELTENNNKGTGSFGVYLIDELSKISKDSILSKAKITKM